MSKSSELAAEKKEKRRIIRKEIEAFNSSDELQYSIFGQIILIKANGEVKIIIKVESPERSFYTRESVEIEGEVEKFLEERLGYKLQVKINKSYLCTGKEVNDDWNC